MTEQISQSGTDESGKRRFQFGLRSLFVINFVVALALGIPKYFAEEPEAILAVIVLGTGATWTLLMAAIGDAIGRELGALIQTVVGAAMWCLLVAVVYHEIPFYDLWILNGTAIIATVLGMVVLTCLRLNGPRASECAPHLTERLLHSKWERRPRTEIK